MLNCVGWQCTVGLNVRLPATCTAAPAQPLAWEATTRMMGRRERPASLASARRGGRAVLLLLPLLLLLQDEAHASVRPRCHGNCYSREVR